MTAEEITPARAVALHTKLQKLSKPKQAKQADRQDVDEFNGALGEAKEAYPNREEVQTVREVSVGIANWSLLLSAKQLMDILVSLNIEGGFDAM